MRSAMQARRGRASRECWPPNSAARAEACSKLNPAAEMLWRCRMFSSDRFGYIRMHAETSNATMLGCKAWSEVIAFCQVISELVVPHQQSRASAANVSPVASLLSSFRSVAFAVNVVRFPLRMCSNIEFQEFSRGLRHIKHGAIELPETVTRSLGQRLSAHQAWSVPPEQLQRAVRHA